MKKNYYEILEINKNASPEIVKKAYTTLAKKYHPDLQEGMLKHEYEEKLKLINEAYEVLSNETKREEYDEQLFQENLEKERITDELINENMNLKNELNRIKNNNYNTQQYNTNVNPNSNQNINAQYENQMKYNEEIQRARAKAYHDAYIQDLKNRGYKIRYKKTLKDYFVNFVSLLITILILILLWQIPFIRNIFLDNILVQTILEIFS